MPTQKKLKKSFQDILDIVDIKIDGKRSWDIKVHNSNLYSRVLAKGSMGLGEAYVDGWWDCRSLDQLFYRLSPEKINESVKPIGLILNVLKSKLINLQTKERSKEVAEKHYNLSTDLYKSFLDPYNQYTCGYFKGTKDLNKAQEHKLDLICKKLKLSKNDKVLDIGCGWGGFAKFASEKYGCEVTGISISDEQIKYAKDFCKGLSVNIIKSDYRDFEGKFDKILVCGMIEHVGPKNYKIFIKKIDSLLKPDGLFLLHTIGNDVKNTTPFPWIIKYIFPGGHLPSAKELTNASEGILKIEDWHNFGAYYDKTLMAWHKNFTKNWHKIEKSYDERFHRMWNYYLLSCAGTFRSRTFQLWQIVYSKGGVPEGYESIR